MFRKAAKNFLATPRGLEDPPPAVIAVLSLLHKSWLAPFPVQLIE